MNTLLLFFALPIATIILAIALQKILKCPILVAAIFFAIYLIVTYAAFDSSFLVFAIAYTIIAYITAVITKLTCNFIAKWNEYNRNWCQCNDQNNTNTAQNVTAISNGTWCCTSKSNPTITLRTQSNNNCLNNSANNLQNNPMVILTNGNERNGRNCNCACGRR